MSLHECAMCLRALMGMPPRDCYRRAVRLLLVFALLVVPLLPPRIAAAQPVVSAPIDLGDTALPPLEGELDSLRVACCAPDRCLVTWVEGGGAGIARPRSWWAWLGADGLPLTPHLLATAIGEPVGVFLRVRAPSLVCDGARPVLVHHALVADAPDAPREHQLAKFDGDALAWSSTGIDIPPSAVLAGSPDGVHAAWTDELGVLRVVHIRRDGTVEERIPSLPGIELGAAVESLACGTESCFVVLGDHVAEVRDGTVEVIGPHVEGARGRWDHVEVCVPAVGRPLLVGSDPPRVLPEASITRAFPIEWAGLRSVCTASGVVLESGSPVERASVGWDGRLTRIAVDEGDRRRVLTGWGEGVLSWPGYGPFEAGDATLRSWQTLAGAPPRGRESNQAYFQASDAHTYVIAAPVEDSTTHSIAVRDGAITARVMHPVLTDGRRIWTGDETALVEWTLDTFEEIARLDAPPSYYGFASAGDSLLAYGRSTYGSISYRLEGARWSPVDWALDDDASIVSGPDRIVIRSRRPPTSALTDHLRVQWVPHPYGPRTIIRAVGDVVIVEARGALVALDAEGREVPIVRAYAPDARGGAVGVRGPRWERVLFDWPHISLGAIRRGTEAALVPVVQVRSGHAWDGPGEDSLTHIRCLSQDECAVLTLETSSDPMLRVPCPHLRLIRWSPDGAACDSHDDCGSARCEEGICVPWDEPMSGPDAGVDAGDPLDAGVRDASIAPDASTRPDAADALDAGALDAGPAEARTGGCGCTVASRLAPRFGLGAQCLVLIAIALRRRRARRSRPHAPDWSAESREAATT